MISFLWGLLGVILVFFQFQFDQVELLFPAVAALIVAFISLIPGMDALIPLQLGLWAGLSFLSFFFLRKKIKQLFQGKNLKVDREEFSGHTAKVVEPLSPGQPGRIQFQGTTWSAVSWTETIPEGADVMILQKEGMGFLVTMNWADKNLIGRSNLEEEEE